MLTTILLAGAGILTALKVTEKTTDSKRETLEKETLQDDLEDTPLAEPEKPNYDLMYYSSRVDKWVKKKYPQSKRWEYYFDLMPDGNRKIVQPEIQETNIIHIFMEDGTDLYEKIFTFNLIPTRGEFRQNPTNLPDEANIWVSENIQKLKSLQETQSIAGFMSAEYKVSNKVKDILDKIVVVLQNTTEWEVEMQGEDTIFFTWPVEESVY